MIWQFTNIWNDFLFGASFSTGETAPMTVALNNVVNTSTGEREYNVHMAAAMIAALPTLLVYIFGGRYFVRGLMAGSVKAEAENDMASLELIDIQKRYGDHDILKGIDISVEAGEFLVLVGPSGCGKSTLLNIIAGLDTATEGDIRIGGRACARSIRAERDIAMVFQSYALYPNMNVAQNISFGMEMRKVPKAAARTGGPGGGETAADRPPARPQAEPALRRAAPARGDGPGAGAQAQDLPVRRAAFEPGRASCAWTCAPRSRSCISASAPPSCTSRTIRSRR